MKTRFYMDVHVPYAISVALRMRGLDVITAQQDGATELSDAALLDRATALGRMLVSQDEDLLREATKRQRSGDSFGGVAYAHQLKITIGQCVDDLELIARCCDAEQVVDQVIYLPI